MVSAVLSHAFCSISAVYSAASSKKESNLPYTDYLARQSAEEELAVSHSAQVQVTLSRRLEVLRVPID